MRAWNARDDPGVERAGRCREDKEKRDGLQRRANARPAHYETDIFFRRRSGMINANRSTGKSSEGALLRRRKKREEGERAVVGVEFFFFFALE